MSNTIQRPPILPSAPEASLNQPSIPKTMTAVVYDRYGGPEVLRIDHRETPMPGKKQALIEVHCASINPIDYRLRAGEAKWLLPGGFPRIPGFDVSGVVVDAGNQCSVRVGSRVLSFLDNIRGGGYAQYAVAGEQAISEIPNEMTFEEAAAVPLAASTALQSLRDFGKISSGMQVLIIGGSGGVGLFAIQIAVQLGGIVTAVSAAENETFCRSLGAVDFIDYRDRNFTKMDRTWDLIFDAAGKSSLERCRRVLSGHGRYVTTEPSAKTIWTTIRSCLSQQKGRAMLARPKKADLELLVHWAKSGSMKIVVNDVMPLDEAAMAQRRLENGIDRGKLVLRVR